MPNFDGHMIRRDGRVLSAIAKQDDDTMGGGGSKNMDEMVNEDWKRIVKNDEIYYLNIHTNERRAFLIEEMPEEAQNETLGANFLMRKRAILTIGTPKQTKQPGRCPQNWMKYAKLKNNFI